MRRRAMLAWWVVPAALLLAGCVPQAPLPQPIQLTAGDNVTPETRRQIEAANAQLAQLRTFLGHYLALPPP